MDQVVPCIETILVEYSTPNKAELRRVRNNIRSIFVTKPGAETRLPYRRFCLINLGTAISEIFTEGLSRPNYESVAAMRESGNVSAALEAIPCGEAVAIVSVPCLLRKTWLPAGGQFFSFFFEHPWK